ncbi:hypothetical protein JL720_13767 [Aureococcus anophagefferens]|nr:hypothetical protein JL720_13767 [Aureococcus anophagefferens]
MAKDDVEMKDAKDDGKKDDDATVEAAGAPDLLVAIEKNVVLIEKAVETSQTRLMMRALRNNGPIRKKADAEVLGAHHEFSAAVLLNGLLRGMLEANLVEAALKLVSKTTFPERRPTTSSAATSTTGRIQAIQLDYSDAFTKLMQSSRKAPANTALGFRLQVTKLTLLVQLLMGEIPDRSAFDGEGMRGELEPYLKLTQAVRRGDLLAYNKVVADYGAKFARDKTASLVRRLSQNVVKTGLRRINVSYSRISLEDVKTKLHLDSVRSAEFVCAKAIKDGVIDAVIDHDNACVKSKDVADIYSTIEPQKAFHRRVVFCLDVHNEAVKAMQYPPDAHKPKKALEDGEEARTTKQTDEERQGDRGRRRDVARPTVRDRPHPSPRFALNTRVARRRGRAAARARFFARSLLRSA